MLTILKFGIPTDMLLELARREKDAGIKPDEDIDIFMKVLVHIILFFFLRAHVFCLGKMYFTLDTS